MTLPPSTQKKHKWKFSQHVTHRTSLSSSARDRSDVLVASRRLLLCRRNCWWPRKGETLLERRLVHLTGCRVLSAHAFICSGSFVNHWLVGMRNGHHRAKETSVAPQHASACKFDPVGAITANADYHADFVPEL